jgi:hypothetical protein
VKWAAAAPSNCHGRAISKYLTTINRIENGRTVIDVGAKSMPPSEQDPSFIPRFCPKPLGRGAA